MAQTTGELNNGSCLSLSSLSRREREAAKAGAESFPSPVRRGERGGVRCISCLQGIKAQSLASSAAMIGEKSAAFSEAPPTSAPSTLGTANISAALLALTEPP